MCNELGVTHIADREAGAARQEAGSRPASHGNLAQCICSAMHRYLIRWMPNIFISVDKAEQRPNPRHMCWHGAWAVACCSVVSRRFAYDLYRARVGQWIISGFYALIYVRLARWLMDQGRRGTGRDGTAVVAGKIAGAVKSCFHPIRETCTQLLMRDYFTHILREYVSTKLNLKN